MKFSVALASALYILPALTGLASAASVTPRQKGGKGGGAGQNQGGQAAKGSNNQNQNANGNNKGGNASSTAAGAASSTAATATKGGDAQSATTLDPKVVATGFALDGQQQPADGQVASLTSTNNFINFCLTAGNKPVTNGQQIKTGSCNPAPMGIIAATSNMPSSKFSNPKNLDNIPANKAFTITMAVKNIQMGNFVNANLNYYSAPQQVDKSGTIIGHSHVVIEAIDSLSQTTPTDPSKFAFFKGINTPVDGQGNVQVDVSDGLPDGTYRLASINAAANHQPVLVAIAQHGSLDDMVYFTVGNSGGNNGGNTGGNAGGNAGKGKGGNNAGASAATATSAAATGKGGKNGGNNNAQGAQGGVQGQQAGGQGGKGGRRDIFRL